MTTKLAFFVLILTFVTNCFAVDVRGSGSSYYDCEYNMGFECPSAKSTAKTEACNAAARGASRRCENAGGSYMGTSGKKARCVGIFKGDCSCNVVGDCYIPSL